MSNVTISTAELPAGFCFQGLATDWPFLVGLLSAQLDGALNTFNYGSSEPSSDNRDKPWIRTNTDGSPDRVYVYFNGFWVARNATPPGLGGIFYGTAAEIDTFDGGESGAVTLIGGPMWEKVSALDAKMPIGAGTLASGAVLAVGGSGGEEKHLLTIPELPAHSHAFAEGDFLKTFAGTMTGKENDVNLTGALSYKAASPIRDTGGDDAHNNMPPYSVVYFIRRTAREFYRR